MADDDGDGIFGAEFGLDSDEETKVEEKEKRTFQSEEDFLQQKRDWKPKTETRKELLVAVEILDPPRTKFDVLTLKSAAELLYYERDYSRAAEVGERALKVAKDQETYVGSNERSEIETLVEKCRRQLNLSKEAGK